MIVIQAALSLSGVIWLAVLFVLVRSGRALPVVHQDDRDLPVSLPSVTVVLPARNEERNIQACLRSLLSQDYPDMRVVVLNDCSEDRTGDLARGFEAVDPRLTVVEGTPLPPGWIGKNWANHQAMCVATGEWLLFTDADVRLKPQAVSQAVALALERGADMLGLVPLFECHTFWEKVVQPAIATLLGAARPAFLVNDPSSKVAISTGGFLLIRRAAYDAMGGHAAIRSEIVDDQALAVRVKARGYKLLLADGMAVMSVRMYDGFHELWAGWRKNLYVGGGPNPLFAALFLGSIFLTSVLPTLILMGWLVGFVAPFPWLAALALLLMLVVRVGGNLVLKVPPLYAFLHPVAAIIVGAIYVASMRRHYSQQGQEWRGRSYSRPDL